MRKGRFFAIALMVIAAVFAASAGVAAEKKTVWKFGHSSYEGDGVYLFGELAKLEIEKEFAGRVEVELFPAGQLGDYVAQQEQVQLGSLQFSILPGAALSTITPEIEFVTINFVLSPRLAVNNAIINEGKTFRFINEKLLEKNLYPIRWICEDFTCWSSNVALRRLEDFKGLKIRVYPSSQIIENYKALGANPTPIPFAEVYSALQLNVAQAQENPIQVIYSNKYYEVQKYVVVSNHSAILDAFVTGKRFWQSLKKEDQEKLTKAVTRAAEIATAEFEKITAESIAAIKAYGKTEFIELDPKERERLVEASKPAAQAFLSTVGQAQGQKILDLWEEDLKEFEAKIKD